VAQVDVVIESGAAVDDNAMCVYLFLLLLWLLFQFSLGVGVTENESKSAGMADHEQDEFDVIFSQIKDQFYTLQ
jgi:hypothetical protein